MGSIDRVRHKIRRILPADGANPNTAWACLRAAYVPGLWPNQIACGIPIPLTLGANATVDLPRMSALLLEGVVRTEPGSAHRERR